MHIMIIENDPRAAENISDYIMQQIPPAQIHHFIGDEPHLIEQAQQADIILLDMHLGVIDGVEICKNIRIMNDHTPILGLTCNPLEFYAADLRNAGAQGLLQKDDMQQLIAEIILVMQGNAFSDYPHVQEAYNALTQQAKDSVLTTQEHKILSMMAIYGNDNTAIADRLDIAESTVRTHMKHMREKLHCATTNDLMLYVFSHRHLY